MHKLGFEASAADPCLFIHKELQLMVLNYCDDQIWLSPDNDLIEPYVNQLKDLGYDLTLEEDGCWKKLIHGGWCATISIGSPEYPGLV
jgi:hypothetical protein